MKEVIVIEQNKHRQVAVIAHRPASTLGLVAIFIVFGLGLIFQAKRWSSTPAYGNLLIIFSAPTWGYIYLAVGIVMMIAVFTRTFRLISLMAHTIAFVLLTTWEATFIIRYLTDSKTTVANVVAWAAYLALVLRSATLIDSTLAFAIVEHDREHVNDRDDDVRPGIA